MSFNDDFMSNDDDRDYGKSNRKGKKVRKKRGGDFERQFQDNKKKHKPRRGDRDQNNY